MAVASTTLTLKGGQTLGPAPFYIMGIVNTTPDSFSDGGRHLAVEDALAHCRTLIAQGAALLDIGGESTRPFAAPVFLAEELARVKPVVEGALELPEVRAGQVAVSVDTRNAPVAAAVLEAGVAMINDVSGCLHDPGLLDVLAEYKPGYVLMHSQGSPETMQRDPNYADVTAEVAAYFEERLTVLTRAGLPEERILLDPGIGFGKTLEHNLELLRNLKVFKRFGRPLLIGLSNKSLWHKLLGLDVDERLLPTVAATALSHAQGGLVHRVHDVMAAHQALTVSTALGAAVAPGV